MSQTAQLQHDMSKQCHCLRVSIFTSNLVSTIECRDMNGVCQQKTN